MFAARGTISTKTNFLVLSVALPLQDVLLVSARPTAPFVMRASSSKSPTRTNASAARGATLTQMKLLVSSVLLFFQDVLLVSAKPTAPFVMRASSSKSPTRTNASAARGATLTQMKLLVLNALLLSQDARLALVKIIALHATLKPISY